MHQTLPKTYPYNPKATTIIFCSLFFGLCAAYLGFKASSNDRGLILNGVITFSEKGATVFYWVLFTFSLGFVLVSALLTIQRALGSVSLEISETTLRIPSGFLKRSVLEVNLKDVTHVSETEVQGQRFLYLQTPSRKYCLNRALMPSKDACEEAKFLVTGIIEAIKTKDR